MMERNTQGMLEQYKTGRYQPTSFARHWVSRKWRLAHVHRTGVIPYSYPDGEWTEISWNMTEVIRFVATDAVCFARSN